MEVLRLKTGEDEVYTFNFIVTLIIKIWMILPLMTFPDIITFLNFDMQHHYHGNLIWGYEVGERSLVEYKPYFIIANVLIK